MGEVELSDFELRLLILGVGIIILILIWLWSRRAQIKKQRREQQLRTAAHSPENEPTLDTRQEPDAEAAGYQFGDFGHITPDHHLADKVLVDVEITPVSRSGTQPTARSSAAPAQEPRPAAAVPLGALQERAEEVPAPRRQESLTAPAEAAVQAESPAAGEAGGAQAQLTILLTVTAPPARPFRGASILLAAQELKLKLHKNGVFDYFPGGELKGRPVFSIAHLREPGTFALDSIGKLSTPGLLLFMQLPGAVAPVKGVDMMIQTARQLAQRLGGTLCNERRERMTAQGFIKLRNDAAEFERQLGLK